MNTSNDKPDELKNPIDFLNNQVISSNVPGSLKIMKSLFFNEKSGRWRIDSTIKILIENNFDLNHFLIFLNKVLDYEYSNNRRKGKKTSYNFLKQLELKIYRKTGLTHHKDKHNTKGYQESLSELRKWKNKYLDMTDVEFINFIHKNIDFPYTIDTLKRTYYEATDLDN